VRLLVSVRESAEASAAVEGGADIVDAKEPARGSLGPVDTAVLAEIVGLVPEGVTLSIALGDAHDAEEARRLIGRPGLAVARYLKLGFAGAAREERVRAALSAAVTHARTMDRPPGVIAVAYADHERAHSPPPRALADLAADSGAAGVLLDTHGKDGRNLLDWVSLAELTSWIRSARRLGLVTAVAGSLDLGTLPLVAQAGPDIIGVRGAACRGGRSGVVTAAKVRDLKRAISVGVETAFGMYSGHGDVSQPAANN
jgi:(5-formylfuran-3-yl)methyl phosphate synthase